LTSSRAYRVALFGVTLARMIEAAIETGGTRAAGDRPSHDR
jgi:hypothetical protein